MSTEENAWHYLTSTDRLSVPRRHVFLVAAGQEHRRRKHYVQDWGAAVAIYRAAPKTGRVTEYTRGYADPATLWRDIDLWCKPRTRTVLWSWDLSVVIRIAQGFRYLPELGWDIGAWSVQPQGTWLIWHHESRSLTMVGVDSFFPMDWPSMVASFDRAKPRTVSNVDAPGSVMVHCARTATTTMNGVLDYLAWIEQDKLGPWQLTGTGQGFAAFRHRFLTDRMLIHWDEDARAAERRAMWAGRTEAYWHGTKRRTRIDEWDMRSAYPRIARDHEVPVEISRHLSCGADIVPWLTRPGFAVLAQVDVDTELPLVPASHADRILWPVGKFSTTLWDPELRLLSEHGQRYTVRRAWVYRTAPALREWAQWILSDQAARVGREPPWKAVVRKHWSRAVIGRLGMQHEVWEHLGQMPRTSIRWWTTHNSATGQLSELVHVGRALWESTGKVDWSMSIPAIPSWIASQCRADLTEILMRLGDKVALYADTDSLLVEGRHATRMGRIARVFPDLALRRKRSWSRITIVGPRQLIVGGKPRVSGVPRRAQLLADGSMVGEVRESLRSAIMRREVIAVKSTPRRWRLAEVDRRRAAGPGGWTVPHRLPI